MSGGGSYDDAESGFIAASFAAASAETHLNLFNSANRLRRAVYTIQANRFSAEAPFMSPNHFRRYFPFNRDEFISLLLRNKSEKPFRINFSFHTIVSVGRGKVLRNKFCIKQQLFISSLLLFQLNEIDEYAERAINANAT